MYSKFGKGSTGRHPGLINPKIESKMKTFQVTYTKHIGGDGTILVKGQDREQALKNAKFLCATGRDFRDPVETERAYVKPRKQGFQGHQ